MLRVAGFSALFLSVASIASAQEPAGAGACTRPDSVAFRGNARVAESALRADVDITPGTTLNYRVLQRAIRSLFATTQFDDVQVTCERAAGRTVLAFTLVERPLLGEVEVRGPDRVSKGTVQDQVDLIVGRPVDPALVSRVIARIDSLYESKGYYLAEIRAESTTVETGMKVSFVVEEGRRLAVSGIRIQGNELLSDRAIVTDMQTRPEGFFWWKKGEFDDDKYAADLTERIPQAYGKHGFIDAQVLRDTLIVDRERGKALVEVTVDEGPQYVVGTFEPNGNRRFSEADIRRFFPFTDRGRTLRETLGSVTGLVRRRPRDPENVFDASRWEQATQQVQEAYANEGYIYAQVTPVVERIRVGPDSTPTVNLRWDITERTPAIVNRVDIIGNDVTVESCIRDQLLVVPGDVFNRDLLLRSYQSISQMQFFETPVPEPKIQNANEQGDIDIVFQVKEKKTGNVSFGASVGQGTGVGGFIGFDQPNLFGLCKRGSLQWQFGRYINDFNLSYTDPSIQQSRVSGTISAYHTRSRFIVGDLGRTTRAGGQVRFGFPVPGSRWTRLFVDYGAEEVSYGDDGFTRTIDCGGGGKACFRSSVGTAIERDTRIDLPFPSAGARQSFAAQFNGGPLGGTAAYQRYTGELRGYTTLATIGGNTPGSNPLKVVTGLSTKFGALFGNPGPFFVYQQFALGGVQYGEQLRGYEEFSISPLGYLASSTDQFKAQQASFGSAFFTTSAELGLRVSQQLYLSTFFDAGNIWARPRDFNPTRLFRGAGVGAALITPLGPLGLDLGYGFDRVDALGRKSPKWQVHFKFGQFF